MKAALVIRSDKDFTDNFALYVFTGYAFGRFSAIPEPCTRVDFIYKIGSSQFVYENLFFFQVYLIASSRYYDRIKRMIKRWEKHMQNKNAVLFDLDGTLTDPALGITKSVAYALESFGIQTDDLGELYKFIGPPLKDSFMEYCGFNEEQALAGIEKYREYFRDTGIYENKLYPGIKEMLEKLKDNGIKVILATSKPKIFADIILEHFDIMKYFDLTCGCEMDGTRGKKGEVIRYALDTAGIGADSVVMVGDRKHDVIGAKEVGIMCIGVLFGYGGYEELKEAGADEIVETVGELENVLLGGFRR